MRVVPTSLSCAQRNLHIHWSSTPCRTPFMTRNNTPAASAPARAAALPRRAVVLSLRGRPALQSRLWRGPPSRPRRPGRVQPSHPHQLWHGPPSHLRRLWHGPPVHLPQSARPAPAFPPAPQPRAATHPLRHLRARLTLVGSQETATEETC